ncbi:hypothetical protein D3C71_940150 [compost metagenome]
MGRAVRADHAGAVDGEQHVQLLHGDVMHQLVVSALQEGGIDGDDRLGALGRHAGGQRYRVLFGDGHVEVALRVFLAETHQARAFAHRRGDAQQLRFGGGGVAQPVAEDVGVGRLLRRALGRQALARVERTDGVVADLVVLGRLVAFALGGHDVQQLRALGVFQALEGGQQQRQVMAVDRAGVVEAHLLEGSGGHEHAFPLFFPAFDEARRRAVLVAEDLLATFAQRIERAAGGGAAEHLGQSTDRFGDGHVVVVEHDQHVRLVVHAAGVCQCFERHAGGHRAVADHRDHLAVIALALARDGHTQRGGNRSRGMADAEGVVFAFLALGERRNAVLLLDRVDAVATAGEDLVRISLVAHVPHQLIDRRVEQVVQGDGEFDDSQPGREVTAALADRFDQVGTQLARHRTQFGFIERAQVIGILDARQARIAGRVDHFLRVSSETVFWPSTGGGASKALCM